MFKKNTAIGESNTYDCLKLIAASGDSYLNIHFGHKEDDSTNGLELNLD
jgi:hypothetical protein